METLGLGWKEPIDLPGRLLQGCLDAISGGDIWGLID